MTAKAHDDEEENNISSIMTNQHHLRKTVSDVTNETRRDLKSIDETILEVECDCCGLREDCTIDYISRIRNSYSGKWVCGLCSEAVKERLSHGPVAIEEAVKIHRDFVQEFNTTTRLNPKLSLTWTMRNIVRRRSEKREKVCGGIMRSTSCVPRIEMDMEQRNVNS